MSKERPAPDESRRGFLRALVMGPVGFAIGCGVKEKAYQSAIINQAQEQKVTEETGEELPPSEEYYLTPVEDIAESGTGAEFMPEGLYRKAVHEQMTHIVTLINKNHPEQPITVEQFQGALTNVQDVVDRTPWLAEFVASDNLLEGKGPHFGGHTLQTSETGAALVELPSQGFTYLSGPRYSLDVDTIEYRTRIPERKNTVQLTYIVNTTDQLLSAAVSNYPLGSVWASRTEVPEDNNNPHIDMSNPQLSLITLTEQLISTAYMHDYAAVTMVWADGAGGRGTPQSILLPLNNTLGFVLNRSYPGQDRGHMRRERPVKKPNQPRKTR